MHSVHPRLHPVATSARLRLLSAIVMQSQGPRICSKFSGMTDATSLPADDAFDRARRPTLQAGQQADLALPPELLLPVLKYLPDNFLATDGRLSCKEAS